jgi:hypothetical protein
MEHPFKVCDKMRNKKYHTVETVLKYHTAETVLKYHTVETVLKYHTAETVLKSNRIIAETETKSIPLMHTCKFIKRVHKFISCLPMVGDSLRVLRLLPPLKLVAMI